jgi:CHRD domain
MKLLLSFFLLVAVTTFSCKKEEAVVSPDVKFMAMLSGAEEVPAVTTTASGMFDGVFNKNTKILTYTITYSGITPVAWHIHKAVKGTNGGVSFNLGTAFSTPYKNSTIALTPEQEADLMAGGFYVNVHSAKNTSGEIRGQLLKL